MYKLLIAFILTIPTWSWCQSLDRLEQVLQHSFSAVSGIDVELTQAQIDLAESQNNLQFQSAFTRNDYAGLELGNVLRFSAGLNYDLMRDGFMQRREEVKGLKIEKEIAEFRNNQHTLDKNYGYLFNYIIYCFNAEKVSLLEQKKFILSSQINKSKNLYYNHELNFEEILYLKGLDEEADILLNSMKYMDKLFNNLVDVASIPTLSVRNLPILEINVDSLIEAQPFAYLDDISELRRKKIDQDLIQDIPHKLSIFYGINYRPKIGNVERTGFYGNFGVRYSRSLAFDDDQKEAVAELKKKRITATQGDFVFNENKELIMIVLDYNSKLRQYSNFNYKLRKLYEQKRVGAAIQKVSTHQVASRKDWKVELEILNVEYELLDIKQLLYLSLLRVYNKAKLTSLQPYVNEKTFDESHNRFRGNRVLKIAEQEAERINNDFVIKYLQKNNFKFALWVGMSEIPKDLHKQLYQHGIAIYADASEYTNQSIIQVPVSQFDNRSDMELWINDTTLHNSEAYLFFEKLEDLLFLDSKTLGE